MIWNPRLIVLFSCCTRRGGHFHGRRQTNSSKGSLFLFSSALKQVPFKFNKNEDSDAPKKTKKERAKPAWKIEKEQKQNEQRQKRGKANKLKKIKEKYGDQDEEDRQVLGFKVFL